MTKHKYSTIVLCGFLLILGLTVITSALTSNDIAEVCNTNNSILRNLNGIWECQVTNYGEMFFHNPTTPLTISIPITDTYYPITGLSASNTQGVTVSGSNMTITKEAVYAVSASMSFSGGVNEHYEIELFVNNVEQSDCGFHRTTTATSVGSGTFNCLKKLYPGDIICIMIKDDTNPTNDVNIETINYKIVEIQ